MSDGLVVRRRARTTGTLVGVYRSLPAGIEDDPDLPWATVCEPHGGCVCHHTRADALRWAPHPDAWCPTCMGEEVIQATSLGDPNVVNVE